MDQRWLGRGHPGDVNSQRREGRRYDDTGAGKLSIRIAVSLAFVALAAHSQTTDFWGTRLPDQPTQFIFGYGSRINTPSRNETAGKPVAAIPVRVSAAFGYVRSWSDRAGSGFIALGFASSVRGRSADDNQRCHLSRRQ